MQDVLAKEVSLNVVKVNAVGSEIKESQRPPCSGSSTSMSN